MKVSKINFKKCFTKTVKNYFHSISSESKSSITSSRKLINKRLFMYNYFTYLEDVSIKKKITASNCKCTLTSF